VAVEVPHEARRIILLPIRVAGVDLRDETGGYRFLGIRKQRAFLHWCRKKTAVPREEEGEPPSCQHQSREEESPDVFEPGFEPGMRKTRRRQGGGGRRRALSTSRQGGGEPRCIRIRRVEAGIGCGNVREEERRCR